MTAKIRFMVRRGSFSDAHALFNVASSTAAVGDSSSARTTLAYGPLKVGAGKSTGGRLRPCFLPGSQAEILFQSPFTFFPSPSMSSWGGTASKVDVRLQKPTAATT